MNDPLGIQLVLDRVLSSAIVGGSLLFGLCAAIVVGLMWYDARATRRGLEVGHNARVRRLLEADEREATRKANQILAGGTGRGR
jgi:hypothetical protein